MNGPFILTENICQKIDSLSCIWLQYWKWANKTFCIFWVIWEPQILIVTSKSEFILKIYNNKKRHLGKNPQIANTGQLPINGGQIVETWLERYCLWSFESF